jgi:hypothetical protein
MKCYFCSNSGTHRKVEVHAPDGTVVMVFIGDICDKDAEILSGTTERRK